jgi:peptidoglycan/LPS O-acetylase OafA/YrhL
MTTRRKAIEAVRPAPVSNEPAGADRPPLKHRRDIQGLRAVAVLLVALGHAGVGFLRGGFIGVDVFFVLSGFLITGLLFAEATKTGHVSLRGFYARRAKRILPAAALTLILTDVAARYLLNFVRAKEAVLDSIWAAFFAANVQFARQGVDYFARGEPASPIQHYWSLAVEEQFYLVWPLLLSLALVGVALHRRRRRPAGDAGAGLNVRRLAVVIGVAGIASLVWSVVQTERIPAAAYFSITTRAWELALGAALAIAASRLVRLPDPARAVMGWVGIAAIGLAAVLFSATTPFPGYAALLPTVGTALVIAAGIGNERPRGGVGGLLGRAPLGYVGDRSYAFYLWHWPVLIIAAQYLGHDLSVGLGLLLLAGAFLLSIGSYALVENPIRHARVARPIRANAVLWGASVGLVLVVAAFSLRSIANVADASAGGPVGPVSTLEPAPTPSGEPTLARGAIPAVIAAVEAARDGAPIPSPLIPRLDELGKDLYNFPDDGAPCFAEREQPKPPRVCRMGPANATRTMVVFGDSHLRHWMPAILWTAQRDGWAVVPLVELGCGPSAYAGNCSTFVDWAVGRVKDMHPDVVLISGQILLNTPERRRDNIAGTRSLVAAMRPFAKKVVVVGDPPSHHQNPPECLLRTNNSLDDCTLTRSGDQIRAYKGIRQATTSEGGAFLDTLGWFCFENRCPMVIDHTVAYRDDSHISVTYALQLKELFRDAFAVAAAP